MNLTRHLFDRARAHPERVAIIDGHEGRERKTTYHQLAGLVGSASRRIRAAGLKPGDTMLLFQPVSLELYVVLLGAMHAGVAGVFLDPSSRPEFVAAACQRIKPAGFFGSRMAQLLRWKHRALREVPRAWSSRWFPFSNAFPLMPGEIEDPMDVAPEHPALYTFTSGSTGFPKAAVRSHRFLLAQHAALADAIHLSDGDVDLLTLPVFALANLASGLTTLIPATDISKPGEVDAVSLARQAMAMKVTRCAGSPALFRCFLDAACLPPFHAIYTGGAPVFPSLLDRLHAARPDMAIHAVYGSTEAEPIADLAYQDFSDADRTRVQNGGGLPAGLPTPAIELAIIPDTTGQALGPFSPEEFAALRLPPETKGEIVVHGDHVLTGYLDGRGDGETKIKVGPSVWHRTGDAGRVDGFGKLWLLGRCSAAIRAGESTIYPFEIEASFDGRSDIGRCALLEHQGQAVLAVEASGPVPVDIQTQATALGIARVLALPALPLDRRHQAKIDYPALREMLKRL